MISKLFYNNGSTIKINQIYKINYDEIKKKFDKHGILLFNNFRIQPNKLLNFTDKFTKLYANDASRRLTLFKKNKIKSVDIGNHEIPLHSESSFTNQTPEIIWFFNYDSKINKTPTTICDGIQVWEKLSYKTRKKFLSEPLIFEVDVNLPFKKNLNSKEWYLDSIGISKCKLNFKKGKISYNIKKFAVSLDRKNNKLAFCNHLLSVKYESQIKKCYFSSGKKISKNIWDEIKLVTDKLTYEHYWKKNQLIMINNHRFLHGRRKSAPGVKREILNIQTLISNF